MKLPISAFKFIDDFREDKEDIGELALSIKTIGLIHAIVVEKIDNAYNIVVGRRRFVALTQYLELEELEEGTHFVIRENLDSLLVQLDENKKRKNFKPLEEARLITEYHSRMVGERGASVRGHKGGWRLQDTARRIGKDKGYVSRMLTIANNEEIAEGCTTVVEVFEVLKKAKKKQVAKALRKARAAKVLENLDAEIGSYLAKLHLAEAVPFIAPVEDASVDLVLTDPPFGINLDEIASDANYDVYKDDPVKVAEDVEALVPEYFRVLKENKFAVIWTGYHYINRLQRLMREAGFYVANTPLHWIKTDSPGKAMDPDHVMGSMLQIAVYGWKGTGAELAIKGRGNGFPYPIVRKDRIHVAQMPEALLVDILSMFSYPGDFVLDTFAGSGSLLRACFMTKRGYLGCEKDEDARNRAVNWTYDWARRRK